MFLTERYDADQDKWFGDMFIDADSWDEAQKKANIFGGEVVGQSMK